MDFLQTLIAAFDTTYDSGNVARDAAINKQYADAKAGYEKQYHELYIQLVRKIIECAPHRN